jgi:putative DNA primase/helicase
MSYDFRSFALAHGLEVTDLYPSDRIRRCGTTEHPKARNGAYFYDGDRGWVQDWACGDGEVHWWDDPNRKEPTQADRDEWARRKAQREREQEQLWGTTATKAKRLLEVAKVGEHNYLHRKGLGDVLGLVLPEGQLLIPMRNYLTDHLCGYQTITWDGEAMKFVKKMAYGTRAKGACYVIGPKLTDEVVLCEGYATGLSIDKALRAMRLRATVLVCFNDSNMVVVSKQVEGARTYVFADNDASGAGERAALATGLNYCMSPVVGEDANDLHKRAGLIPLQKLIMEARKLKEKAA